MARMFWDVEAKALIPRLERAERLSGRDYRRILDMLVGGPRKRLLLDGFGGLTADEVSTLVTVLDHKDLTAEFFTAKAPERVPVAVFDFDRSITPTEPVETKPEVRRVPKGRESNAPRFGSPVPEPLAKTQGLRPLRFSKSVKRLLSFGKGKALFILAVDRCFNESSLKGERQRFACKLGNLNGLVVNLLQLQVEVGEHHVRTAEAFFGRSRWQEAMQEAEGLYARLKEVFAED